jgi:hypothetical protein
MASLRNSVFLCSAIMICVIMMPARAHAQWWATSSAPRDFEECAERAKNPSAKQETATECEARFAGRRKPGGGYTYYDFMQNRSFDIAGPNPTPEETRKIDEHYTAYLAEQRRNAIASAFLRKQQSTAETVAVATAKPVAKPLRDPRTKVSERRRTKVVTCHGRLSCSWQQWSTKIHRLKKNLFAAPRKSDRS